jgi:hypothetical protein
MPQIKNWAHRNDVASWSSTTLARAKPTISSKRRPVTQGFTGAADSVAVLRRSRFDSRAEVRITGKQVREQTLELTFENGIYVLLGETAGGGLAAIRRLIRSCVEEIGEASPTLVSKQTGLAYESTKETMRRKAADGQLIAMASGVCAVPVRSPDMSNARGAPAP